MTTEKQLADWIAGAHPGATVRIIYMIRGAVGERQELGDVRVQDYGPGVGVRYRVGTFLPGIMIDNPGDTPKVEPETHTWHENALDAEDHLQRFAGEAVIAGWQVRDVTTGQVATRPPTIIPLKTSELSILIDDRYIAKLEAEFDTARGADHWDPMLWSAATKNAHRKLSAAQMLLRFAYREREDAVSKGSST